MESNAQPYGDDGISYSNYFEDPNFRTFYQEAQNHGFVLDRYAPWRLGANLKSQPMKKYMEKNGYANMQDVFEEMYFNPLLPEFYEIVKMINILYSDIFPKGGTYAEICYKNGKTSYSLKPRETYDPSSFASLEEMIEHFGYPFYIRVYAWIKAREANADISQKKFDDIVRDAANLKKAVDIEAAVVYINNKFDPLADSKFDKKATFTF